ncbi:MAG: hypothetical protein M1819_002059 [Sarea resinae]|nr:MAG: hypothetical protein M1819_002059 [Sarea resinae]
MDPFSILAGTAGLLDVSIRFANYLRDFQEAAAKVDAEILDLIHEFEALIAVNESINVVFEAELERAKRKRAESRPSSGPLTANSDPVINLWRDVGRNLKDCQAVVEKLEQVVDEIVGEETVGKESSKVAKKIDAYKKQRRKELKDREFRRLRDQLTTFQRALHMLMTAITTHSIDELSGNVRALDSSLHAQIESLKPLIQSPDIYNLRSSVQSAVAVASWTSPNKHFDIPQTVSSMFTGRKATLAELKVAFNTPPSPGQRQTQKRFVIYGLGGSGKTQFCCKFAQENRKSFWSVFWIDGSSEARVKQTFSKIANIGGVEPNETAARNWLSNLEQSWLLIIDNADDPRICIERCFPEGERGHILVTTRNPALKLHGTVGARSFHFEELEDDDANHLLLKAANKPRPWDVPTKESASVITKTLGALPLALIHAGKAIMNGFCTLSNYIASYDMNWQRVRRARRSSGSCDEENIYLNVYTSYEVIFLGLEAKDTEAARDAIELLKIFSFLHRENIRVDILTKAVSNPEVERKEEENQKQVSSESKSWAETFEDIKMAIFAFLLKDRSPPVLPKLLRDTEEFGSFDDYRLRIALNELTQMSLTTYNYATDSYYMHPLVHTWVRERPKMSTPEQAVWCQAAATTLGQSILLPPLGNSEADETFRRDLLPHLEHVQKCQQFISEQIANNQRNHWRPWRSIGPKFDRGQALRFAKFSLVYAQCGHWDVAERLQLQVKDFVCKMLGAEHPRAVDIMLALSGTYWQLGRGNEAADLQAHVLQICNNSLGKDNPKTFKVMDTLGVSRWQQGRFTEALDLHERAAKGMRAVLGADHEETLKASTHLGRVHDKFFQFEQAKALHLVAVDGLKKTLGPTHLETLSAMDNLAMTYLSIGGDCLISAQELLVEVAEQRKQKLGKEHPYTLWATCNLARVETALGYLEQAEDRMNVGLQIAQRNLGEDHIGTLYGRVYLAQVLVAQERYEKAEEMFLDVIERHKHMASASNSYHPDRISAMSYLFECYRRQGKFEDALCLCDEILTGLRIIGGHAHPLTRQLEDTRKELLEVSTSRRDSAHASITTLTSTESLLH